MVPTDETVRATQSSPARSSVRTRRVGGQVGHRPLWAFGESFGGCGHAQALVGSFRVVLVDPGIESLLGEGKGGEDLATEELLAEGPVEPLHFARCGRRCRGGQAVGDAVLPTDLVEEHLGGLEAEPVGEDLAIVGEDLFGDPVALEA